MGNEKMFERYATDLPLDVVVHAARLTSASDKCRSKTTTCMVNGTIINDNDIYDHDDKFVYAFRHRNWNDSILVMCDITGHLVSVDRYGSPINIPPSVCPITQMNGYELYRVRKGDHDEI